MMKNNLSVAFIAAIIPWSASARDGSPEVTLSSPWPAGIECSNGALRVGFVSAAVTGSVPLWKDGKPALCKGDKAYLGSRELNSEEVRNIAAQALDSYFRKYRKAS